MKADLHFHDETRPASVWSRRAKRAASALMNAGLGSGAKIGLLLPNGFDFIEANTAVGLASSYPVPISTHLRDDDYRALAQREALDALITTPDFAARWAGTEQMRTFLIGENAPANQTWEGLISHGSPTAEPSGSPPGQMFFTSGSTNVPKTVVRETLPIEISSVRNDRFARSWGMVAGMRTVITGPLYHQAPLYYAMGAVDLAERVVILDDYAPITVLAAIAEHRVTHLHLVPRLMIKLANLPKGQRRDFNVNSLVFALHGAAACPRDVKLSLIDWWGPILREYYATSEFGIVSQIDSMEWMDRPSSVGRAFEGVQIEIRDLKNGEQLPSPSVGQIYVRSDDMPAFRYHQGDETTDVRKREDWITVGDVGYLDEDDYLHLTGRADDTAIISGVNFNARVTQAELMTLPYVDNALVEIVADKERGDALRAAVCLKKDAGQISAIQIIKDLHRLPPLAIPREIAFVDELPVTDAGKTITRYLDLNKASRIEKDGPVFVDNPADRPAPPLVFPAGVEVNSKELTESTNDDAVAGAAGANGPLTLFWADRQSSGRGRSGRKWVSERGNVYWSMLVDTTNDRPNSTGLVFVTALAVLSTVRALTPGNRRVQTKWPNDTLIDGRKVSGVLIEQVLNSGRNMHVVGVGINVNSYPDIGTMFPASCLRMEGSAAHRNDVLMLLTSAFVGYLQLWRRSGFQRIKEEYIKGAYRFGETISVRSGPDKWINGVFSDVTELGLVLKLEDGSVKMIGSGDLFGSRTTGLPS